ncbi:hypothetical protein HGRIS_006413 [Hohenbuehelia grisea]|uniref:BZIP domain-containing protein n=1 Tax=Hohenbuehelia grisea TaxID=104357 RepID=A0ABR3K129_9AGAR
MASSSSCARTGNARKRVTMVRTVASSSNSAWQYTSSNSSFLVPEDDGDVKPVLHDIDVEQSELISSPTSRTLRQPAVPPSAILDPSPPPPVAISVSGNNTYYNTRQDVRSLVNTSASLNPPSTATRNVYLSPSNTPLESSLSSFPDAPHGSLGNSSTRLRTNRIFSTSQDLAAHYGIPTILPPAPRTTPRRTSSESQSPTIPSAPSPPTDFAALSANYLNMLNTKPEDNSMVADNSPVMTTMDTSVDPMPALAQEVAAFLDAVSTSPAMGTPMDTPAFDMTPDFNFLTSPWDDSPLDELLSTPLFTDSSDLLTGPLIGGYDETLSLFGATEPEMTVKAPEPSPEAKSAPVPAFDMEGLYTMSPVTPSLDPTSLYPSPRVPTTPSFPTTRSAAPRSSSARRSTATGTRKNITPDTLVPLDAPTQSRSYVTPSATSRKEVPAVFARKRARSQAFGDEEDELANEEGPGPNATEREQIEWKRRQNTLAARKSRKRKLEHQQMLEGQVHDLTVDRDRWRTRAEMMSHLLRSNGIPFQDFDD